MRPSTRMLLMSGGKNRQHDQDGRDRDYRGREYDHQRERMGYEPEDRFRDRRGREHYDDGRYAPPRSEYGGDYDDMGYRGTPSVPPVYEGHDPRRTRREWEDRTMNRIGFALEGQMDRLPEGHHIMGSESDIRRTAAHMGRTSGMPMHFTRETAMEWVGDMENADGSKGPRWSMEKVQQVMDQRGINCDPLQFFAVMNSLYSDYCSVAAKYNVNKPDFYIDLAKAWLDDPDAAEDKAARYFTYVVKR